MFQKIRLRLFVTSYTRKTQFPEQRGKKKKKKKKSCSSVSPSVDVGNKLEINGTHRVRMRREVREEEGAMTWAESDTGG